MSTAMSATAMTAAPMTAAATATAFPDRWSQIPGLIRALSTALSAVSTLPE